MLIVASLLVYLAVALLIDSLAVPRGRLADRPAWAHATAVLTLTLLYASWFALSWRPVFATGASLITFALLTLVSNYKYRNVLEPVNFVDFALVRQIWRHPQLYQAGFLRHPLSLAAVAAVLGYIALWCTLFEASVLPDGHVWDQAVPFGLLVAVIVGWIIAGPLPRPLAIAAHHLMLPADSARHVRELGLAASLTTGLVAWRYALPGDRLWPPAPAVPGGAGAPPLVIAVQSESFVDVRREGRRDVQLPGLDAARAHAVAHGRVSVPVQGAWTLRSEFAFLAGRPLETFGLDGLHPYLRLSAPPRTLAHHLRDAGFATLFVHPFDLDFFNRRVALPRLGFDRLIDDRDFTAAAREGYFVPDMALAERVLAVAADEARPLFCMIATMENHNPWDRNRIPGIETPVEQYLHHLRNADRMIARLVEGIEHLGRPAVLAFYGDHVPTLPALADPFPDPRTDYFVMGFRDGAWLGGEQRDCALHQIADMMLQTLQLVGRHAEAAASPACDAMGVQPR